ncbi:hypothetical protein BCR32DRAFT_267475 [Anaeromyces robustus]|uniref:FAR-17a/AIG1-like protein n=1 Tax=Anaeromyces robustus TaxID=1754192 RepID=A0A1Y1XAD4_9FUNG|nr:hypothetical protein BCR32DRAFT_267475 [Anaeromyces robustus]|eukprot:ORX82690.1 hypothetical protein BCR32DRAFT_267475 [Anaeromyces robustus]
MSIETLFASDKFNLFQTITPYKGTKKGLLIYRIIALLILLYGLYASIYSTINHNPNEDYWIWFAYFTNQNYTAVMIYFTVGIINYFRDAKGKLTGRINNSILHTLVHIYYNILFPLAIIITAVFWGLMFPFMDRSHFKINHWLQEIIQHLFNSILMSIDWFFLTIPSSFAHFIPMFVAGVAYLIFSQIYHAIYDIWIYGFLDRDSNSKWYLLYGGLVIAWSAFGFLFSLLQNFKNKNRKFIGEENTSNTNDNKVVVDIELV